MRHIILLSKKMDLILEPHGSDLLLDFRQIRAFPYKQKPAWHFLHNLCKNIYNVTHPFNRPEIGNMHQNFLALTDKITSKRCAFTRVINAFIDKVVGKINRLLNIKQVSSFLN